LLAYVYHISFRGYRPLKWPLSFEIAKNVAFGPRFVGGRDTPDFGHAFSNYTYFRPCGRIWFSSEIKGKKIKKGRKKKERKKERIPGKICPPTTMSGGVTTMYTRNNSYTDHIILTG